MKTLVFACLLLAGCEAAHAPDSANRPSEREARSAKEPKPSVVLVNEVESRVLKLSCVGNLSRWDRDYRYDFRSQYIDTANVLFVLIEVGGQSERQIKRPHDNYNVPCGQYRLVAGVFNTKARTMKVEQCGAIVAGPIP
jgi:hypothetical protein